MNRSKILLVEDEENIMQINENYLKMQGYEIFKAGNCKSAYKTAVDVTPDLIVLDVMLPDGSGIDLCKKIRSVTTAPILFLTCKADIDDKIEGLLSGGDDYIIKPYNLDEFGARVAAQLRRADFDKMQRIDLPPLSLDLVARCAYINGVDACLTAKEFALLLTLVEHRGQDLTNEQLYKAVWGGDYYGDSRTIRVHIHGIRKKLGFTDDSELQIKLRRNNVYCFVMEGG